MKMFRIEEYIKMKNPNPGEAYRAEILTAEHNTKEPGEILGLLVPGSKVPYHYHESRESVIFVISGDGIEIIEGDEFPIKVGGVQYIPAGEKHTTVNRSDKGFRYLEFFTYPPVTADFVEVK
jgi:quercetin dioxygenase-like cupin family protein